MIFRPPLKRKWLYPIGVAVCLWVAYGSMKSGRWTRTIYSPQYFVVMGSLGAVALAVVSWSVWTSKIEVDDQGVRWKDESTTETLRWEQMTSLVRVGDTVGFMTRGSEWATRLPFVTRKLYEVLARRLNRLTPEEERILFS